MSGFVGLVDESNETHIPIQKPSKHETNYINRQFYHSIYLYAIYLLNGDTSSRTFRQKGNSSKGQFVE